MKPDGGVKEKTMEAQDMEPSEFFMELGMLILESRLPASSIKGRQEGPHCPPTVADRSSHVCDMREPVCRRASEMQKQMQALWRNHIPMCIEVLLFPDCPHGQQKATSTDAALPVSGDGCILLEQWTIQLVVKKSTESCLSSKALFQAMRSYLHFSQLSAWLNLSQGNEPRHVGYRVSPPAEFCTTTFSKMPESHLFPLASANKSTNVKVTLAHLPRLPEIPTPICQEITGKQRCDVVNYPVACPLRSSSPNSGNLQGQHRSRSPKIDKPNVLHVLSAEEREMLMRPSKCLCADCKPTDATPSRFESNSDLKIASCHPKSSPDLISESVRQKSPVLVSQDPAENAKAAVKETGAIPKKFSLQLKTFPDDLHTKQPRTPQHPKAMQIADEMSLAPNDLDLKHAIPAALPSFLSCNRCKDLIPEVLPNRCQFLDGMESDSSSPDYDHFLSRTLMKQSEPMTLEEMEVYLQHLYLPSTDSFRDFGFRFSGASASTSLGKSKQRNVSEGEQLNVKTFSSSVRGARAADSSKKTLKETNSKACSAESCNELAKTDAIFVEIQNCEKHSDRQTDHSVESGDRLRTLPTLAEVPWKAECASLDTRGHDYRPIFTVGDFGETDNRIKECEMSRSTGVARDHSPSLPLEKSPVKNEAKQDEREKSPTASSRTLHKSISCPSKPTLKNSGFNRANSLLKTVMKKEMMSQQPAPSDVHVSGSSRCVPTNQEKIYFRKCVQKSSSMVFHAATGLPLQSSPVPAKKLVSGSFEYDSSLDSVRAIKNSLSCINLDAQSEEDTHLGQVRQAYSTSAPASTNCLLGNFEESLINGRIEPAGVVSGFTVDIGASGSFCPQHITLPVTAFFFSLSDDNAPSPYLGHINLESYSKRGYHIPKQGTIQVTLFNPNKTVVKMFVVKYDMSDMPPNHQTVLRQRTLYMPVKGSSSDVPGVMVYLRYLIHLRFASSKTSKIYLHTDIRVIFARDKFELDSRVANYELRSFTEGPENPKFSPRK